jgi:putative molybdopterin biosynthesis protein
LKLDFIPLFNERYDLIIPKVYVQSELLAPLFDLFSDNEFRKVVSEMPGYDVSCMGQLISELE